jgi:hypothetical protein
MPDDLRVAQGRAEARQRAIRCLERAGFVECAVPAVEMPPRSLLDLVPRSAPLPQRLVVIDGETVLAVVLHDENTRAFESELVALAHEALGARPGSLAVLVRSLEPARALLAGHGVDAEATARLLEDPRALPAEAPETLRALAQPEPRAADPAEIQQVLLAFLGRLRFKTYGTRSPEEVAARLASRLSRTLPAMARRIQAARAELIELASLDGRPDSLLERAATVLGDHRPSLEPLRAHLAELARLGVPATRVELAGSPGPLDPSWSLESIGAGVVARGGSFKHRGQRATLARLEIAALPLGQRTLATHVLVIPVREEELAAAQTFALEARAAGLRAELDPSGRNLRSALRAASRRGIPFAVILGEREVRDGLVQVKDLRREEQQSVPRPEAPAFVLAALASAVEPRVKA